MAAQAVSIQNRRQPKEATLSLLPTVRVLYYLLPIVVDVLRVVVQSTSHRALHSCSTLASEY